MLLPQPDGQIVCELSLSHICGDAHDRAATYLRNCEASDLAYHFIYDDEGVPRPYPTAYPVETISPQWIFHPQGS